MRGRKAGKESAGEFQEQLERLNGITAKDPYLGLSRAIVLLDKYGRDAKDYIAKRRIVQNCFLLGLTQWFEQNSALYEEKDIAGFLGNVANRKKFLSNTLAGRAARNRHLLESQRIFYDTVTTAIDGILTRKGVDHMVVHLRDECGKVESNYAGTLWLRKKVEEFGKAVEAETAKVGGEA